MAQNHIVIPGTMQGRFVISLGTTNTQVVTHFVIPDGTSVDPALANAIFGPLAALWIANIAPLCPAETILQGLILKDLRSDSLPDINSTTPGGSGTAVTSDLLPRSIASCLTVRTNRAGRKFRGRMFWPGYGESANDADGHMTAAAKSGIDAFSSGFLTAVNKNGAQFAVAHRPTEFDPITGLPVAPGLGFSTIAIQVVCRDNVWDSQRRRNQ